MKFFSRIRPTASLLVVLLAGILLPQSLLLGQATTGSVTGTVADSTGALIPNANVVLTNAQTGDARKTVSDGTGNFAFASVVPSLSYKIEASAPNFRSWESQPFPLRPGDQISFADIKLQVGTAVEQAVVEASVESLRPQESGERSDVISAKEIETLAVVGRDATELVRMLPGFALSSGTQGLYNRPGYNTAVVGLSGPTGSYSANGSGTNGITVVADGVSLTDIGSNSGTVQNVNMDGVSEIKATTSSYSAENAKGPAIINVIGKSGGSVFHGSAYLYARNAILNSNDWYDNFLRQSRPEGQYFYPGVTVGGPVLLPFTDFNRGKNKLFFFGQFEYTNQFFEANQAPIAAWVPTMGERQGDFSPERLNAELCGGRPDGRPNPNSIQPMCYTQNYLPTGESVDNNNVRAYANSGGVALINWLPLPNADPFTNVFGYNYIQQVMQNQNGIQLHGRVDYVINDKNKLFVNYGLQRLIQQQPIDFSYVPPGSIPYPAGVTTGDVSNTLSVNYTRILTSTLTNELTAAMSYVSLPGNMDTPSAVNRFDMNSYNCNSASARASGGCGTSGNGNFDYLGMYKYSGDYAVPALENYSSLGYPQMLMPGGFYNNQVRMLKAVPDVQDTMSWLKGSHFFKFGAYFERAVLHGLADFNAYPQGKFTFNPGNSYFEYSTLPFTASQFTACQNPDQEGNNRSSGAAYLGSCMNPNALMYMGYADTYTQTNFSPVVNMKYTTVAGFINDTWKLHKLTLNLGVRVEHLGPWVDRHNNGLATFSPALYSQQCTDSTRRGCNSQNMPGLAWHSIDSGVDNSVNSPPMVYVSPRFGFAWDILGSGDTVLRGGGGVYRNQEEFNPYALAAATAQGYKTSVLQGPLTFDLIDSQSPLNPPDFSVYTVSKDDKDRPIFYEYNLAVSQRIPWHRMRSFLEVAYVGNRNQHLSSYNNSQYNSASDANLIPFGTLFNVNLGSLPPSMTSTGTGSDISNLSTPEQDFFRPYPFYNHVYQLSHRFYSNYNSLQISWNKTGGFVQFGANYTFSKNLATAASYNNIIPDPVDLRNDYIPVPFDRTHVFNIHYLIDIGKRYHRGHRILAEVVNDWQISGISTAMSGFPLASVQGENFGFGYGQVTPTQVHFKTQRNPVTDNTCAQVYGIPPDSNGNAWCVTNMSPTVWLGTPDIQLMPNVLCDPAGGKGKDQYINPLCFGVPLPESNGQYRLPYIHGPAFMNHDLSLLKNIGMGEKRNLQLRLAAFNFLNHPLVSFNQSDTTNLTLAFQNATPGNALTQTAITHKDFGVAGIKVGNRLLELSVKYEF